MSEHEFEPIPGLPEDLPEDESILWQGAPDWQILAKRTFHLRILGLYFLVLLGLRAASLLMSGSGVTAVLQSLTLLTGLALLAAGLFTLYAWLIARSTLYTITNKRLVMRFGIALSLTMNLPFRRIQSASVKCYGDGYGDIPITLDDSHRISYVVMWPHVRPWQFTRPQPMLRGISQAWSVAEKLADAASSVAPKAHAANEEQQSDVEGHSQQAPVMAAGEMS